MKENPDLWADILNGLKNSWPQISGSVLAALICYGRLIYDGVERKNRWVEALLCGALSWSVSSGLEMFGKRPLLVAISTQAPTDANLFSIWLDDAANSNDPKIVSHVHSAPMDLEITDPDAWKAANPALDIFLSLEEVEGQAKRAARMPSEENRFRNLVLNQRVSLVSPFISRNAWMACAGELEPIVGKCYAGLDLSAAKDLTALVIIGKSASGK
ncbi:terminase [Xenorhabdus thuongxuanensis]|uniref:Terminase n=1 Tax=Xenorhabdus thuongxuanensis TaxID=1873484 RepID=A0A1Q5U5P3_9GAMM|nr:terminase [Xenorhabdus thuongxuanensis]